MLEKSILFLTKYNFFRELFIKFGKRKQFESKILRLIYSKIYKIDIGMYSYGCFTYPDIPTNTKIGRYCSFGPNIKIFNANHPSEYIFLHPFMYNTTLGLTKKESFERTKITIGNDVWIGANVIILPSVKSIGDGVIIGAGSIVTKDLPDYAIAVGNPARIIKYRLSEKTQKLIKNKNIYDINKSEFKYYINNFYDEKDFIELMEKEK